MGEDVKTSLKDINVHLQCIWKPKKATYGQLDFIISCDSKEPIEVLSFCFSSLFRLQKLTGSATLKKQIASFHEIQPDGIRQFVSQDNDWAFQAKHFVFFGGRAYYPHRTSDGPKGVYAVILYRGQKHFIDVSVDFQHENEGDFFVPYPDKASLLYESGPQYQDEAYPQMPLCPVIPRPQEFSYAKENQYTVFSFACILDQPPAKKAYDQAFHLARRLFEIENAQQIEPHDFIAPYDLSQLKEGQAFLSFEINEDITAEAYQIIQKKPRHYVLLAADEKGFFYGFVTLYQFIISTCQEKRIIWPQQIIDAPRFGFRGTHLDVARQFYPLEDLQHFADQLAWYKMNYLHLHLSDDEAWRIEIQAYPELTKYGAFRGHNLPLTPMLGSKWEKTGGYYTQDEMRQFVDYCHQLHIEIIPEIDIPGHSHAILQSLPWLRENVVSPEVQSVQGFGYNVLNPAMAETYQFTETVFTELSTIFPSSYVHVGADEVAAGSWLNSPACMLLSKKENMDHTTQNLQAYFLKKLQKQLKNLGKYSCAWEEAGEGKGLVSDGTNYLNKWLDARDSVQLLEQGYQLVLCPANYYYLDIAADDDVRSVGLSWCKSLSMQKIYQFEPILDEIKQYEKHILGIQSCIWSENIISKDVFKELVFPRILAVAESAWTEPQHKSWPEFSQNMHAHISAAKNQ